VRDEVGRILPRVRATLADGSIVEFRRLARRRAPIQMSETAEAEGEGESSSALQLLSTPLHVLLQEARDMREQGGE
jgi:hypothetical protein